LPAPDEPNSVSIENVTSTSLSVRWSTGSTQNIANVSVFYRDFGLNGDFTELQVEQTNATNCITVDSLTPGHVYEFYVRVCSRDKKCSRSQSIDASTLSVGGESNDSKRFRDATIALGVITGVLLILLIVLAVIACRRQLGNKV
jgi:hypothetical protein